MLSLIIKKNFLIIFGNGATTFSIKTVSIMTLSITTVSIMTLSITTVSIMTLSIKGFICDTYHHKHIYKQTNNALLKMTSSKCSWFT